MATLESPLSDDELRFITGAASGVQRAMASVNTKYLRNVARTGSLLANVMSPRVTLSEIIPRGA